MNNTKSLCDAELARLIKDDSREAYRELFDRYTPAIYHFALSYLKTEVDAEGLVQDVFLKIWEHRLSIDPAKNFKSYIFKIAVNSIYDLVRKRNIQHAFDDLLRLNFKQGEEFTWHKVIYEELQSRLDELVGRLPAKQQQIFRMNKEEGLSNDEIAAQLQLSKRTVENQLYRAVAFLKEHFKEISPIALLFFLIYLI